MILDGFRFCTDQLPVIDVGGTGLYFGDDVPGVTVVGLV
jgi:hypothetical protein